MLHSRSCGDFFYESDASARFFADCLRACYYRKGFRFIICFIQLKRVQSPKNLSRNYFRLLWFDDVFLSFGNLVPAS